MKSIKVESLFLSYLSRKIRFGGGNQILLDLGSQSQDKSGKLGPLGSPDIYKLAHNITRMEFC